jgi:hypothetical protein
MNEIAVKKSYKDGCVSVRINLKARGWNSASVTVQGATDLSSAQARDLAASFVLMRKWQPRLPQTRVERNGGMEKSRRGE